MSKHPVNHSQLHPDKASKALLRASQSGDLQKVKALLNVPGIDFNAQDEDGDTPLMLACLEGHVEIVSLLLKHGPQSQLNLRDHEQETALFLAAGQGHLDVIKIILDCNLSPEQLNAQCDIGMTPLIISITEGHSAIASLLISRLSPAQLSIQDNTGMTSLMYALSKGNTEIAKMILAAVMDAKQLSIQCEEGWTALMWASMQKEDDIINLLLDAGLSPEQVNLENKRSRTALMIATHAGHLKIVESFLKKIDSSEIIRANKYGETALLMSARMGNAKCITLLLEYLDEDQVRDHGIRPLIDAIWYQYIDIVKLLVDAGIDQKDILTPYKKSKPDPSPLLYSIAKGNEQIIQTLLSKISSIKKIDEAIVKTHLLKAIEVGSMDAFEYFLPHISKSELCASSRLQNDRNPYLMAAINHNQVVMVERLLKEGVPAGGWHYHYYHEWLDENSESSPALFTATQKGYVEIVKLLLEKVSLAQVGHHIWDSYHNPGDDQCCSEYLDGTTALMAAAQNGHFEVVALLLDAGLNQEHILYEDNNFKTALDLAATDEIKKLIEERLKEQ